MRDSVFKARFKLKPFNPTHSDHPIFINYEDLTAYRAHIAAAARRFEKERQINDVVSAQYILHWDFDVSTSNGRAWSVPDKELLNTMYRKYKQLYGV